MKRYADAKDVDDYKNSPRPPNDPYRKFANDDYKDVTRKEQNTRFANFEEDMRAAGRNLSTSKLNAQKKKICIHKEPTTLLFARHMPFISRSHST